MISFMVVKAYIASSDSRRMENKYVTDSPKNSPRFLNFKFPFSETGFPVKVREHSLPFYFTQNWGNKKWIYIFPTYTYVYG